MGCMKDWKKEIDERLRQPRCVTSNKLMNHAIIVEAITPGIIDTLLSEIDLGNDAAT